MTDEELQMSRQLFRVQHAQNVVRSMMEIAFDLNNNVLPLNELQEVLRTLNQWEKRALDKLDSLG